MEHAQRAMKPMFYLRISSVLILILMEHAQRENIDSMKPTFYLRVLILILMEHAQRALAKTALRLLMES